MIIHDFPKHVHVIPGDDVDDLLKRLLYYNQGENPYINGYINNSMWRFNVGSSKGGLLILSIPKTMSLSRISLVFRHKRDGVEVLRDMSITLDKLNDEKNVCIPIGFYQEIQSQCYADKALGVYTDGADYSFDISRGGPSISVTYIDMTVNIINGEFDPFKETQKLTAANFKLRDKEENEFIQK